MRLFIHRQAEETILVSFWFNLGMPATLTLKNIPDDVYERLKLSAATFGRSMTSPAIVCLEAMLLPAKVSPAERLARARALRATLPTGQFDVHDIDTLKGAGRP